MTSARPGEAQRVQANIRKLSLLSASHMFLVVMPVTVLFYRASGLDMREVYLLQSVFAVGTLLLEVPTGYAADHLGRKKTLVAGSPFYAVFFGGEHLQVDSGASSTALGVSLPMVCEARALRPAYQGRTMASV